MTQTKRIEIRLNEDTIKKIEQLQIKFAGDYPTKSQVIRSAVHYLHNKRLRDEVFASELL